MMQMAWFKGILFGFQNKSIQRKIGFFVLCCQGQMKAVYVEANGSA